MRVILPSVAGVTSRGPARLPRNGADGRRRRLGEWAHELVQLQSSRSHRPVAAGGAREGRRRPAPGTPGPAAPAGGCVVRAGVERADLRERRDPPVDPAPRGRRAVLAAGGDRPAALRPPSPPSRTPPRAASCSSASTWTPRRASSRRCSSRPCPRCWRSSPGRPLPLFQGVLPPDQVQQAVDQVLKTALANGMVGRAQPVAARATAGGGDPGRTARSTRAQPDPRFAAADEALAAGDFAAARDEFDRLLRANPNDAEAALGKAQAGLFARASVLDPQTRRSVRAADRTDVQAQLDAADLDLVSGARRGSLRPAPRGGPARWRRPRHRPRPAARALRDRRPLRPAGARRAPQPDGGPLLMRAARPWRSPRPLGVTSWRSSACSGGSAAAPAAAADDRHDAPPARRRRSRRAASGQPGRVGDPVGGPVPERALRPGPLRRGRRTRPTAPGRAAT